MTPASTLRLPFADHSPPFAQVRGIASDFGGLTNFVLGMFVSTVLGRIYYAQRDMLGTTFSAILGFVFRLVSSLGPIRSCCAPPLGGASAAYPSIGPGEASHPPPSDRVQV